MITEATVIFTATEVRDALLAHVRDSERYNYRGKPTDFGEPKLESLDDNGAVLRFTSKPVAEDPKEKKAE